MATSPDCCVASKKSCHWTGGVDWEVLFIVFVVRTNFFTNTDAHKAKKMSQQQGFVCSGDYCEMGPVSSSTTNENNTVSNSKILNIEITSDIACPFCFLGKLQLEKALAEFGAKPITSPKDGSVLYTILWKPFLLNPSVPSEGEPRADFFRKKFGFTPTQEMMIDQKLMLDAMPMLGHIEKAGKEMGIKTMNVANFKVPLSNTINSHRLLRLTEQKYPVTASDKQNLVADKIFRAYFEEGKNVSDAQVMWQIVRESGLEGDVPQDFFLSDVHSSEHQNDTYLQYVKEEAKKAGRVTNGVPYFSFSVSGGPKTFSSGAIGVNGFAKVLKTLFK